jgi:Amidase
MVRFDPLPASCNGVFGIKPSRRRVSWAPRFVERVGVLIRTRYRPLGEGGVLRPEKGCRAPTGPLNTGTILTG